MPSALIVGLAGHSLTPPERDFLASAAPAGIILFTRNCRDHEQIRVLVAEAREAAGGDLLVLIDQEGGRVQRLRPPLGRALPPAAAYARLYGEDGPGACMAAAAAARLVAEDLSVLGVNTNCAPVLDLPAPDGHAIIGDRAYGRDVAQIVALGRAVAEGFLAGGVLPVIKHIPGHGRATKDSHLELPVVTTARGELSRTDFAAFAALAGMPAAMTAHVVFRDIDASAPASASATVIGGVIRNEIGFDGLLMSDDLGMKALSGRMRERAEAVIRAGSDLALHCSGDLAEMEGAAAGVPTLAGRARERFDRAWVRVGRRQPFDVADAERRLTSVLALSPPASESV